MLIFNFIFRLFGCCLEVSQRWFDVLVKFIARLFWVDYLRYLASLLSIGQKLLLSHIQTCIVHWRAAQHHEIRSQRTTHQRHINVLLWWMGDMLNNFLRFYRTLFKWVWKVGRHLERRVVCHIDVNLLNGWLDLKDTTCLIVNISTIPLSLLLS